MNDISIELGGYVINFRAAAIISHRESVLVLKERTENWYYLPGGRIKAGETTIEAVEREVREEVGDHFEIRRPILGAENFFTFAGRRFQEFCAFYQVEWLGEPPAVQREGSGEAMLWVPRTEIAAIDLRPAIIKSYISSPPPHIEWAINREA